MDERIEVAVIGAGQAGLAVSHHLTEQGRDHVLLERATRVADRWHTDRWDSLRLVSPNWALRLPGSAYAGDDPDGFLGRAGAVRYLEDYAASFGPPVRFGTSVSSVAEHPSGAGFLVSTDSGRIAADAVVVAIGPYHRPARPAAAGGLPPDLLQLHSCAYRNPGALPPGAVLVVGTGQSGAQIAEELQRAGREVYLSVGGSGRAPRRYRGRDIDGFVVRTGMDVPPAEDEPALRDGFAVVPVTELDLAAAGITSVVWATGYRYDWGIVRFPVFEQQGYPIQRRGVTAVPGLYFLGLQWMHTRKSATFWGVGEDAAHIAEQLAFRTASRTATRTVGAAR